MKKIIIFSSNGGGGHTAVSNALKQYLQDDYIIHIANAFDEVLEPLDFLQSTTKARISGEKVYNFAIARKWYTFLNIYYKAGAVYFTKLLRTKVEKLFNEYIDIHKPDIIISVIPLINSVILDSARKKNIPFLLIPTDLDISTFLYGIENPDYNKFNLAIPFETQEIEQKIIESKIDRRAVSITGFVLRPDFFEEKNLNTIKAFYDIPQDKPVILLLLGAVGLKSLYKFATQFSQTQESLHLILCIGKQENLTEKIKAIPFPPHISITIMGFTDRISDLMAISDLLITKSGSVTVCEAIYMNLPLILDATSSSLLTWERYNHSFIKQHHFGDSIDKLAHLPEFISQLIAKNENIFSYKKNLNQFDKKHGGNEIKNLIKKMVEL